MFFKQSSQSGRLFLCLDDDSENAEPSLLGSSRIFVGLKVSRELFKGLRIPKAAPLVADRSRRNSGQYRTIAAHALLESYSVSLHINPLTCVSKSAVFLCNLTKNLTSQSAHPNLCGVALTTESAGGESKQSGGLFWRGEPSPGVPRCEAQNGERLMYSKAPLRGELSAKQTEGFKMPPQADSEFRQ